MQAISLCFHDVADTTPLDLSSAVYTLSREDFLAHLSAIRKGNPAVGTISQFSTWQIDVPLFLTFDDGGLGDFHYAAPALEDHRWRGHFFITTNWIDQPGYMSRVQLRELHNRGHVIGSHSCSHPERMSSLTLPELLSEWEESCAILRDILEAPVCTASVAGGYYSRKVAIAAARSGITVLFTSEPTSNVGIVDGCLVLGRYSIQRRTHPEVSGSIAAGEVWHRWHQCGLWNSKKLVKTLAGDSYITLRRRLLSNRLLKA